MGVNAHLWRPQKLLVSLKDGTQASGVSDNRCFCPLNHLTGTS